MEYPLTVEGEIDANGNIRLLEPLPVTTSRRVLVTFLEPSDTSTDGAEADVPAASLPAEITPEIRRQQQMEWLKTNAKQYGGQYVALVGQQLVGVGKTFRAASEAASAVGWRDAFVTYLPKPDEVLEMGGWV